LFWLIVIVGLIYLLFWLIAKMGLPEPMALIARIAAGLVGLYLILGLFVPGLGVRLPGM